MSDDEGYGCFLGEGESGSVRVSRDGLTAVKTYTSRRKLEHELDIQRRCAHIPSVVQVVDHHLPKLELRMERLAAESLEALIERDDENAHLTIRRHRDKWIETLAATVDGLETAGIAHNDFKSKNMGFRRTDPTDPSCTAPDYTNIVLYDWDIAGLADRKASSDPSEDRRRLIALEEQLARK